MCCSANPFLFALNSCELLLYYTGLFLLPSFKIANQVHYEYESVPLMATNGGGGVLATSADNLVRFLYGSEFIALNQQKQIISHILDVNDLFC